MFYRIFSCVQVTSILETEKSKRRLIELEDDKLIQIKLWGQKSNLTPLEGETVLFKCLVVDIYRNTFSLNSTSLTSYQVGIKKKFRMHMYPQTINACAT